LSRGSIGEISKWQHSTGVWAVRNNSIRFCSCFIRKTLHRRGNANLNCKMAIGTSLLFLRALLKQIFLVSVWLTNAEVVYNLLLLVLSVFQ